MAKYTLTTAVAERAISVDKSFRQAKSSFAEKATADEEVPQMICQNKWCFEIVDIYFSLMWFNV